MTGCEDEAGRGFQRFKLALNMQMPARNCYRLLIQDHFIALVVIIGTFGFYAKTLGPTVMWGDPAKLTVYAFKCTLSVYAENHLLRSLLGWLWGHFPFQDYAYGQNLLSAFFASLTSGAIYYIVLKLTNHRLASISAALALGLSHTFWRLAVLAESYSLLFFLISFCILSALMWGETGNNRWLCIFCFAFGLGITDHAIMPLFAPAFILYFLLEEHRFLLNFNRLLLMLVAFVLGLAPLIGVFIYSLKWHTPAKLINFMTADSLLPYLDWAKFFRELLFYPAYLFYQFPFVGFLFGLLGMRVSLKKDRNLFALLACMIVLDVCLSAAYMHARQFEIIVPSYLAFSIAIGIGFAHVWKNTGRIFARRLSLTACRIGLIGLPLILPIATYYTAPLIVRHFDLNPLGIRYLPYRDNARYFFLPDKSGYTGAARYGREVLSMLPENAVILADFSPGTILEYMQKVEGLRPDVKIIGVEAPGSKGQKAVDAVEKYFGQRPIYFTDYHPYPQFFGIDVLSKDYNFVPRGNIYEVIKIE